MRLGINGENLIKSFEQCRLVSYKDSGGIWTIGWGHTKGVHEGLTCTQEQADAWFEEDAQGAIHDVDVLVKVAVSQNQIDALVSFQYNTGGLHGSTLLSLLNAGNLAMAAEQFLRWDHVSGKQVAGLTTRRKAERSLFLREAV